MQSRCLFCDKRLSLFHGKKKPFCSDAHEDQYLESHARSGLDRLRDSSERTPSAAKAAEPGPSQQFAYPEIEAAFFEDAEENGTKLPPQRPDAWFPPPADYLISGVSTFQPVPPFSPFLDPATAAFPPASPTQTMARESLTFTVLQIDPFVIQSEQPASEPEPPSLVTALERLPFSLPDWPLTNSPAGNVSAIHPVVPCSLPRFQPRPAPVENMKSLPPALVTSLALLEMSPLSLPEATPERSFCEPSFEAAVSGLAGQPRHFAPRFIPAPPTEVSLQPGRIDSLPPPQPLRLRTLLDLGSVNYQPTARRIAPASLSALHWNAAPIETGVWPLGFVRRRPGPVMPATMLAAQEER